MSDATPERPLEIAASRHFTAWLAEQGAGLAFTACQAGKLFLLGLQPDGRLSLFERTFPRCIGLAVEGRSLWLSTLFQLWRFEDALALSRRRTGSIASTSHASPTPPVRSTSTMSRSMPMAAS